MKEEENNNTEKVMTKDEKIADLEQRLARLEKIEKRRKIMSGISLGFKLIVIIILAIVTYKVYNTLKDFLDNHNINIDLVIFDLDSSKYYK